MRHPRTTFVCRKRGCAQSIPRHRSRTWPRRFVSMTPLWSRRDGRWSSKMGRQSPMAEWPNGAGYVAAIAGRAAVIVDPRLSAAPALRRVFETHPHIGFVLPAVGYNPEQLQALETTINGSDADVAVSGAPADLGRL